MGSATGDELDRAIQSRCEVEYTYDGQPRIVRPAAHGLHVSTGNEVMRGYQVGGGSNSQTPPLWDLFLVEHIRGLVVTDRVFADDPLRYSRNDRHIHPIFAQL